MERVWSALTQPEELAAWLDRTDLELRIGGRVTVHFDDGRVEGEIRAFEPPHVLEYSWRIEGEPETVLRFELERVAGGTRLVLTHTGLPDSQAVGYAAGWHAHLDRLAGLWSGAAPDWGERFAQVRPFYADRFRERATAP